MNDRLEKLFERLDDSRERLLVTIESLPDQALLLQNAVGEWRVADVIANLTAWEAEVVTGLMRLKQGKRPGKWLAALDDPQGYDAKRYEENKGRDLDRIFADFQRVRVQLEGWLERFSEEELGERKRFKWFKGASLEEMVAKSTFERELRFVPALERFARRWGDGSLFQGVLAVDLDASPATEGNYEEAD